MAKIVREIMNAELFSVRRDDDAEQALGYILALGITAAPVLDDARRPVGVVSFRDLLRRGSGVTVSDRMTSPAITVREDDAIEHAAVMVAERGIHRLVVTDAEGVATGVVSSVDLIAGLLGLPAKHPDTFPHYDRARGISWTDDTVFDLEHVDVAPDGPGVLCLLSGGRDKLERVVWAESAENVRTRLYDLLSRPQDETPGLARILALYGAQLRFRASALASAEARSRVAESVMADAVASVSPRAR